jgi:hypothetical protein
MSHNKLLKWSLCILAVGLLVLPSSASDYSYARIVRLSYIEGVVQCFASTSGRMGSGGTEHAHRAGIRDCYAGRPRGN